MADHKGIYDCTEEKWIDAPRRFVRASPSHLLNYTHTTTAKENHPRFSLVEWFIIGPMVVGLGFMAGIMWP